MEWVLQRALVCSALCVSLLCALAVVCGCNASVGARIVSVGGAACCLVCGCTHCLRGWSSVLSPWVEQRAETP